MKSDKSWNITRIKDILKDKVVLDLAGNMQDLFKNEKVKKERRKKCNFSLEKLLNIY